MATSAASAFEEVKETLGAWLVPSQPANGALEGVQGLDASDAVVCSAARALLCAALEQCSSPYTPAAAEELARIITRVCSVDFKATRPQFALELLDELLSSVSLQNAKSILDRVNLAELLTGAADDGGASPLALQVLLKVLNGLLERASPVLHAPFRTQLMLLQCLHAGIDHRSGLNLLKLYSAESELHETSVGGKARSTPLAKFIGFAHSVTRLAPVPDTTTDSKTENTTPASSSSSSSSVSSSSMSYAGLLEFTAVSNSLLGTFSGRQSTNKGKQTLVSRMDTATAPLLSSADMSDPEIVALHDPLRACVCVQILILALHVSQSFCGSPDCPSDVKAKVDALVVAAKRTLTRLDKPTEKLWHKIAALESTWTGWKVGSVLNVCVRERELGLGVRDITYIFMCVSYLCSCMYKCRILPAASVSSGTLACCLPLWRRSSRGKGGRLKVRVRSYARVCSYARVLVFMFVSPVLCLFRVGSFERKYHHE
jgi:hypothetical protein